ncbi:class I SAM-dependent methyltransferase [Thermomonas sp.]|uniref:class I SAM-dependent methyltransferase n=1 Tax=Thermomonas sp. TaxID=1971895 RepID=UPI002C44F623|nr:class I SAM-dependent methyltransferase [Thermomonas sp.]HRO63221.1 class I SAM-dependent methyltransferase [Thermomonas sp.]
MSYSDDYSLASYGQMIEDTARLTPWREALRRHIHADSVFLDLGCGPGVMSFLAVQLGARKVYAIEPDGSIEIAKRCAADIPGAERIEWIRGLSTEMDLPEPADIIAGDLHGTVPFYTHNIASLADARRRHLRPGGVLLPSRDTLYAVPASAPLELESIDAPWRNNALNLDLTAALPWLVNHWWRARSQPVEAEQLLAEPQSWGCVDYRAEKECSGLDCTLEWTLTRTGRIDGLYVWFDGEVDDGIGFSNSPLLPERVYGRAFFPLEHSVDGIAGDRMRTRMTVRRVNADWVYRWDTTITTADGQPKAAFKQSTFKMLPGELDNLRKSEAGHTPTLGEAGKIQQAILAQMDGQHSLSAIAHDLMQRFPKKFRTFEQAFTEVASSSRRFG